MRKLTIAIAALALGACTPLTSPHPLFSVADQTGPAPLTEGVWVALEHDCTREMATVTPLPSACEPMTLSRTADGAWILTGQNEDQNGTAKSESIHLVVVPAVATPQPDAYAPLYVAQLGAREVDSHSDAPEQTRIYGAIAPISSMPATEVFFANIDCSAILREGPITGVTAQHDNGGNLTGCTTDSPAAVREAARRAIVEEMHNVDESRLVFVHP